MNNITTIYLVDDHTVVRNGLKELIEHMGSYTIAREFDNGADLINSLPFHPAPDLLIMDLTMPVMDGKETVAALKARNIEIPVLILTIDTSDRTIIDLYKLGVRGYLPKHCTTDLLKKAIDDIADTGYYHSEMLIKALQADMDDKKEEERQRVLKQITERERIFLELVCNEEEYTYEQMADILKVHRRTIDGYRESLFEKFNIKSKTGLVLFAIKYGLINTPAL